MLVARLTGRSAGKHSRRQLRNKDALKAPQRVAQPGLEAPARSRRTQAFYSEFVSLSCIVWRTEQLSARVRFTRWMSSLQSPAKQRPSL